MASKLIVILPPLMSSLGVETGTLRPKQLASNDSQA
jgi:hypothetical protein